MNLPKQSEVGTFYGKPGPEIQERLVMAALPYPMRLDWDLSKVVKRTQLHKKCAPAFTAALTEVLGSYGMERIMDLGLDRFAGGYAHRSMRGGSDWSMHAYGCATDFFAGPNGLKVRCPHALFCKPEYKDFLDIMERHGWLSALRLWGADAMHFQMARL